MEIRCAACGANQDHNLIRCEQRGKPLVFAASELKAEHERAEARRDPRQRALFPASDDAYRDDRFDERACDYCGKLYRCPAVYCSLECATDDL
jgi:hypothetical protein